MCSMVLLISVILRFVMLLLVLLKCIECVFDELLVIMLLIVVCDDVVGLGVKCRLCFLVVVFMWLRMVLGCIWVFFVLVLILSIWFMWCERLMMILGLCVCLERLVLVLCLVMGMFFLCVIFRILSILFVLCG